MRQLKINKSITRRTEGVEKYLNDIARIPLLTTEEEIALAIRKDAGDEQAREMLINANLRFVVSCAKQYEGKGNSLLDIIEAGNCGLIKAVDRFDHTRGFKLISCAVWWIRQSILEHCRNESRTIRIPQNVLMTQNKAVAHMRREMSLNGRNLNIRQAAEELELRTNGLIDAERVSTIVSFDLPVGENETNSLQEFIGETPDFDEAFVDSERASLVKFLKSKLNAQQYKVVVLHFGLEAPAITLDEVALIVGLSRERCRQLKESAIDRLKKHKNLKTFLAA
jgi:RNA polymerase primary sigma factor